MGFQKYYAKASHKGTLLLLFGEITTSQVFYCF